MISIWFQYLVSVFGISRWLSNPPNKLMNVTSQYMMVATHSNLCWCMHSSINRATVKQHQETTAASRDHP